MVFFGDAARHYYNGNGAVFDALPYVSARNGAQQTTLKSIDLYADVTPLPPARPTATTRAYQNKKRQGESNLHRIEVSSTTIVAKYLKMCVSGTNERTAKRLLMLDMEKVLFTFLFRLNL